MAEMKTEDGKKEKHLLFYDGESVSGKVNVTLKKPGSKLEHQGIKIEFIGQIGECRYALAWRCKKNLPFMLNFKTRSICQFVKLVKLLLRIFPALGAR